MSNQVARLKALMAVLCTARMLHNATRTKLA